MTDDLGMRKAGRRRRTTRRLTRRPIRVPGDDVPRQSKLDAWGQPIEPPPDEVEPDEQVDEGDESDEPELEAGDGAAAPAQDRTSSDMLDVDLEVEGEGAPQEAFSDGPVSGVIQAPAARAAAHEAPALGSPKVVMPGAVALHTPESAHSSVASVPPPPPAAISSLPPPGPALRVDSAPPDAETNPRIDLAELMAGGSLSDHPTPIPPAREHDEPTRPRIELSDMVMSAVIDAGRGPDAIAKPGKSQPPGEDADTNPRIAIDVEEEAAPVVVMRAHMIGVGSDDAGPDARRSSMPATLAGEELESLELEDEAQKLDLPPSAAAGAAAAPASVGPRVHPTGELQRSSKAPPPPPEAPKGPPRRPTGPLSGLGSTVPQAALQSGSTAPQPPAAALKAPPPPPPGTAKKSASVAAKAPKRRQWWEDFFSDDYLHSVITPTPAQVSRQVDFMEMSLGLTKGATVLDVGCGLGLTALELARRGYLVVGLDLSLPMITRAAEAAQQEGLRINFLHSDMREIAFQGMFDGIVCAGTSFGFFDDETNRDVLVRLCSSLKPGGRILMDVANRDHVMTSQPNLVWFEGEGCVVMEESDFNYYTSRLIVKRTMMREDGRQSDAEYSIRLYSLHELGHLMQQAGFRVGEVSGQEATRGVFFGSVSARIILLAERRGKGSVMAMAPAEQDDGRDRDRG